MFLKLGLEQIVSDFNYPGYEMHFPEFQIIGKYVYFPIKHFKSGHENTKHHYSLFSMI